MTNVPLRMSEETPKQKPPPFHYGLPEPIENLSLKLALG